MKINVLQAKKAIGNEQTFEFVTSAEELAIEGESPWKSSVIHVEGKLINNGRVIAVEGVISANAQYQCSCCLEDFSAKMEIPFSDNYQQSSDEAIDDEADLAYYTGDEIDIADLVRESLILAEPLKSVCGETCLGLCPHCGINLNTAQCDCQGKLIDPRLAVLQKLLK
ncbi:uncharacterized protein SAMN04490355_102349 [Pelosinus propionicus DSM 13327]|uniref:DUF177 domain-containing protein n=2 Tax=Pelosinus TaxID=365348 RepID=A0A1I4LAB4_9FIRM|nr:uncharacterized protein SAMN04490355_102349 [Pelosinus propionicus DSM 13327]